VKENYKKFQCQACDFAIWRILSGRQFEPVEIEELIIKREIGPLQGFRSRLGKPFAAVIKLNAEFKLEFDFGQQNAQGDAEPLDFSDKERLGTCPKCGAGVYAHSMAYLCENAGAVPRKCDFRTGKIILQRNIEQEQVVKLLSEGKTDLLHGFISKKGRPFSAYLVRGSDGKIGFEFAPRAAKSAPKKSAAKPRKAAAS
ncbi:MAG TPA: topoisomerase C-terminal repeat-containing protein, partial [Burkholderiales bacterium]|nr:topoisomerase C-terminal repeat-containing protein [Burkholderiales bacterium]